MVSNDIILNNIKKEYKTTNFLTRGGWIVIGLKNSLIRSLYILQSLSKIKKILDLRIDTRTEISKGLFAEKFSESDPDLYCHPILIASDNYEEIASRLKGLGLFENLNFRALGHFLLDYFWLEKNKIYLDNCQISCTNNCTLQCKDCMAFAPYCHDKSLASLDYMERNIKDFFRFCDNLNVFRVIGGEPFLHPRLADIFEYIEINYGERIHVYEITTNGTVMPSKETLERLGKLKKLHIHISDYTDKISSVKKKVDKVEQAILNAGISCVRKANLKWQDFHIQDSGFRVQKDVAGHMRRCEQSCQQIGGGRFYICGTLYYAACSKVWESQPSDCFDLSQRNDFESKVEFYLYNKRILPNQAISLCEKCAGMDPLYEFPIDAAIQL